MPDPGRGVVALTVVEATQVGEARRLVAALARDAGLDALAQGRAALIVTELANNLARHARGGEIVARATRRAGRPGVEVTALDRGPGVAEFRRCLVDGYSTAGTPGNGLGAVARAADRFDAHSEPGAGTVVLAEVLSPARDPVAPARARLDLGAVCLPMPGEAACGDAWDVAEPGPGRTALLVADGLGHGPRAAEASGRAVEAFRQDPRRDPAGHLAALHEALRGTRGAAVAVAEVDLDRREVRFAGVGNVAGAVLDADGRPRGLASHNGTVGVTAPRIQEFTVPWPEGGLLILHSDGVATHWRLADRPALRARASGVIAGALYRDFGRGRDDATVVAARAAGPGES